MNNGNGHQTGSKRVTANAGRAIRHTRGEIAAKAQAKLQGTQGTKRIVINSLDQLNLLHREEHEGQSVLRAQRLSEMFARNLAVQKGTDGKMLVQNLGAGDMLRTEFLRFLLDGPRDIDAECGYPNWLTPDHYRIMYDREGIARRVVECEPEETWAMDPELYETEDATIDTPFEEAWDDFNKKHNAWHYLQRIDCLSGIGQFGILLLGVNDGKPLNEPVDGINDDGTYEDGLQLDMLYMRPFSEEVVFVKLRQTDTTNRRYGMPLMYTIHFRDFPNWGIQAGEIVARDVHWSRVIHVADNRKMSEIYGTPRMQTVWNRLYDLRKIYSSSGEAFWKGGFPGLAFEVNPDLVDQGIEIDAESVREEFQKYANGLQRYLAVTGVTTKSLQPTISDPTGTVETHLKAIAISKGIPFRVLFGSEEGQLAGSQDHRVWNKRLAKRQSKYVNPMIIRPFIDRLIAFGILPKPEEYFIDWPDLNTLSDTEKAQVASTRTQAMSTYAMGQASGLVPPRAYLHKELGYTMEEIDQMAEEAAEMEEQMQEEQQDQPMEFDEDGNPIPPGAGGNPPPGGQEGSPPPGSEGSDEDPEESPDEGDEDDEDDGLAKARAAARKPKKFHASNNQTRNASKSGGNPKTKNEDEEKEANEGDQGSASQQESQEGEGSLGGQTEDGLEHGSAFITKTLSGDGTVPKKGGKRVDPQLVYLPSLNKEGPHEFTSVQLNLPIELPEVEGITEPETEPHVTALYGIDPMVTKEEAEKHIRKHGPINLTLGDYHVFRGVDDGERDALVMKVESQDLAALHGKLRQLKNSNKYPQYVPHVTVGYAPAGTLPNMSENPLKGTELTAKSCVFSHAGGKRHKITLNRVRK